MTRIYKTWDQWECYPAGFFGDKYEKQEGVDPNQMYADFLRSPERFGKALETVLSTWPNSCDHNLSNQNMNRIAWLGQAAACVAMGLPADFRSGYHLLSETEQQAADALALKALNKWLKSKGEPEADSVAAVASQTEMNLY